MSDPSCDRRRRAAHPAGSRRRTLLDRLCELYPERGREQWYAAVACGEVLVDGERVRDPQRSVAAGAAVERIEEPPLAPAPATSCGTRWSASGCPWRAG